MIEVLLVDERQLMRAGLKRLIEEEGDIAVMAEAGSGDETIRLARVHRAGVVVLDTCIGDPGVLETLRLLGRVDETLSILALGDPGCGPLPARILELGASGYLSKQADGAEIRQAIRKLSSGGRHVCAEVAQHMVLSGIDSGGNPVDSLSARELSVMLMLSEGHPRDEISDRLCITQKTVSTYRSRLMKKLGARNDVDLTYLALHHGLVEPRLRAQLS
jgi:two-component system invasion response regulator UvrY